MESAIQASSTLTGKINIVSDLINVKVHAPSNLDFSPEVSKPKACSYLESFDGQIVWILSVFTHFNCKELNTLVYKIEVLEVFLRSVIFLLFK